MKPTKATPTAAEFMKHPVHVVTPETKLCDIIQFLLEHRISNAPVVDKANRNQLLGFISERDCLAALANESFFGSPAPPQLARTLMRRHPVCVAADTELFTLASLFVNHGYRHIPVTDGKTLLGIVSRRDILRAMNEYYSECLDQDERGRKTPDLTKLVNHRFLITD